MTHNYVTGSKNDVSLMELRHQRAKRPCLCHLLHLNLNSGRYLRNLIWIQQSNSPIETLYAYGKRFSRPHFTSEELFETKLGRLKRKVNKLEWQSRFRIKKWIDREKLRILLGLRNVARWKSSFLCTQEELRLSTFRLKFLL